MCGGALGRLAGWWLAVGAVASAVVVTVVGGLRWDGYSHRSQYISELGARGAPDGAAVSAGFLAVGVLFLLWAMAAAPRAPAALGLAGAGSAASGEASSNASSTSPSTPGSSSSPT